MIAGAAVLAGLLASRAALAACPPVIEWERTYDSPGGGSEAAYAVAVDPASGSYVVVGTDDRWDLSQATNWLIRKYDSGGNLLWSQGYNGSGNTSDVPEAVAIDAGGNIFVGGKFGASSMLQKYSAAGTLVWTRTAYASNDAAYRGIATDGAGNVIATNYETVVKYASDGSPIWSRSSLGINGVYLSPPSVAVDAGGNIVVVVTEGGAGGQGFNWLIRKFDPNGNELWSKSYNTPLSGSLDDVSDVAVDGSGNIFVVGIEPTGVAAYSRTVVRRYDGSGNLLWSTTSLGTVLYYDEYGNEYSSWVGHGWQTFSFRHSIAIDSDGGVLVSTIAPATFMFVSVTKLESGGGFSWVGWSYGLSIQAFGAGFLARDASGKIIIVGATETSSYSLTDWKIVKLAPVDGCLDGRLATSSATPAVGQSLAITLSVTNPGTAETQAVTPALEINSGGYVLTPVSGPAPAGPISLAPGASQLFVWTYSVTGIGEVAFTATATGVDSGTGLPVLVAVPGRSTVQSPAGLVATVTVNPVPVPIGQKVTVLVTAVNTGGRIAVNVVPSLQVNAGAGFLQYAGGPVPTGLGTLPPGGAQAFAWTYVAAAEGAAYFTGTVSGTEESTGAALSGSAQGVALLNIAAIVPGLGTGGGDAPLGPSATAQSAALKEDKPVVYPNPASGDEIAIALPLDGDAEEVSLSIYNSAYTLVASGSWKDVTRAGGTIVITGVSGWAPGVYFVRARAKLAGGETQDFPAIKAIVKR